MGFGLLSRFFSEEATADVRSLLLRALAAAASDRHIAVREFSFNTFDVRISFEERQVLVTDVLMPDAEVVVPLDVFAAALDGPAP